MICRIVIQPDDHQSTGFVQTGRTASTTLIKLLQRMDLAESCLLEFLSAMSDAMRASVNETGDTPGVGKSEFIDSDGQMHTVLYEVKQTTRIRLMAEALDHRAKWKGEGPALTGLILEACEGLSLTDEDLTLASAAFERIAIAISKGAVEGSYECDGATGPGFRFSFEVLGQ